MANVSGKSVILTGGGGDIARVVAGNLVAGGARVLLVDLDEGSLVRAMAELDSSAVSYCVADVTSEEDTQRYVATALERLGSIDVLLANAGIEGAISPITEYDKAMFDKVMAVNVTGPFLGIKHVFPVMAANGGGSIVVTSSIAGYQGVSNISAYVTSKHAVIGLMRSCAREGAEHNIRVNTVNPAPVEGRMVRSLEQGFGPGEEENIRAGLEATVPLGRYAMPEDVANLMLFLISDESHYLTGGVYSVDGGVSAT